MIKFICKKANVEELTNTVKEALIDCAAEAIEPLDGDYERTGLDYSSCNSGKEKRRIFAEDFLGEIVIEATEDGIILYDNLNTEGCLNNGDYDLEKFIRNVKKAFPNLVVSGKGEIDYYYSVTEYEIFTDNNEVKVVYDNGDEEFSDYDESSDGDTSDADVRFSDGVLRITCATDNEETKAVMANIWPDDDEKLKRLLLIPTRDCLTTTDITSLRRVTNMSFELLCEKGYIQFEIGENNSNEVQDCYIFVEKVKEKGIFGEDCNALAFTVICKNEIADIDGYRARHVEICSALNEILNGKEIAGVGNELYFSSCQQDAISDDYSACTIWFNNSNFAYVETGGINVLGKYAADNESIVRALSADDEFKVAMELKDSSEAVLYPDGYFRMHESFVQNLNKEYPAWVLIEWMFFSDSIFLNVLPVCRVDARKMSNGDDRLERMIERIKVTLNGLSIALCGKLEFAEEDSQDEIKVSDDLIAAMIVFK